MKTLAEVPVERQVDVDALVGRAVERPHRRLAVPQAHGGTGEQHQPGRTEETAAFTEDLSQVDSVLASILED